MDAIQYMYLDGNVLFKAGEFLDPLILVELSQEVQQQNLITTLKQKWCIEVPVPELLQFVYLNCNKE